MELKNKSILEVKIGERTYAMECYADSPLGEVHDALSQMKAYVVQRIVDMQKNEAPKDPEEVPCEEVCPK